MIKKYQAEDIKVLEGLDAVRLRPGMYIGSTGEAGLHHLLWEILDNAIDETANGFGDVVEITLNKDNSVTVSDNGRGIPVDNHPTLNIPGVVVVFTKLHAGGKFYGELYENSGGLHGVGASVVNALSEWLNVTVYKNKTVYEQKFASIENKETGEIESGVPISKLKKKNTRTKKSGTTITFKPDKKVFSSIEFNIDTIIKRVEEISFLNKNLKIHIVDKRNDKTYTFVSNNGINDFVLNINKNKKVLNKNPIYICDKKDDINVEISFQFNRSYSESIISYVNNIPTPDGGFHELGFKNALTRILNDFGKKQNFIKEKDPSLSGEDFREGIVCIINIKMKNPQFEGQVKGKLGNPEVRGVVETIMTEKLISAFSCLKKYEQSDIFKKAITSASARMAAKKAKEITRAKNKIDNPSVLVGKLSNCTSRDSSVTELFIVEGDSAGGSAKMARNRSYQAILPLKGKPLNVEKKQVEQLLQNNEYKNIIAAINTSIGSEFNIDNLNYGKIIILSDADQDGAHIRALLLTFFFKYMRELVKAGHVYIGVPPLYKITKSNKIKYLFTEKDFEKIRENNSNIQRFKGLGEMNPDQLWDTTMNPETRMLYQVKIDDCENAEKHISVLMGSDVELRKEFIANNINFKPKGTTLIYEKEKK